MIGQGARPEPAPWWWRLSPRSRAQLAGVVFGGNAGLAMVGAGVDALAEALEDEPLLPAARRAVAAAGVSVTQRRFATAIGRAELDAEHRALLRRVTLCPIDLGREADPVAAVRHAHRLNTLTLIGGHTVVALVDGHLVYLPRQHDEQPPATPREALERLTRRDAALGRWWRTPAPPIAPGRIEALGPTVVVGIAPAAHLEARVELASAAASAAHPHADEVVVVVGDEALVDVCPRAAQRAARWSARASAQRIGEAVAADPAYAPDAAAWAGVDQAQIEAITPPAAPQFAGGIWRERLRLEQLPLCGPKASPLVTEPRAAAAAIRGRSALVVAREGGVRAREGAQGRPRELTVADYATARAALEAEGRRPTDVAVTAHLVALGRPVTRTTVRLRRIEAARAAPAEPLRLAPYAGAKGRLLPDLVPLMPARIDHYVETCLGSGAVYLALAAEGRIERATLSDADPDIVHLWQWIQRDPDAVFEKTRLWAPGKAGHHAAHDALADAAGAERAAAVLRVLWTGFNGLWRRRGDGALSVPPGTRKRIRFTPRPKPADYPKLSRAELDALHTEAERAYLRQISALLEHADIFGADAEDVIDELEGGEVVYCDPPYWPISDNAGGRSAAVYGGGFQSGDLVRCVGALRRHAGRGGLGLLSNAATREVVAICEAAGAELRYALPTRTLSSTAKSRCRVLEVIAQFGAAA